MSATTTYARQPVACWPGQLQPRERLLERGAAALNDAELLAILLRTGARGRNVIELAHETLLHNGSLTALAQLHVREWEAIKGIGRNKAATVMAAFELGRRTWAHQDHLPRLDNGAAVYRHVAPRFLGASRESMWVLGLDSRNRVVVDALVGAGTVNYTAVHPREVFRPLLRASATRGIVCHNHPSGDVTPSRKDIELTERLIDAGRLLDVPLVDHIIAGQTAYTSLRDHGLAF